MPRAISSAALRSSALDTLPRNMTTEPWVSTAMCLAFVRPSFVSASFLLVVIQESLVIWPTPSPLGFVDSSAFTVFSPSGGGDCASDLADNIIRRSWPRPEAPVSWRSSSCLQGILEVTGDDHLVHEPRPGHSNHLSRMSRSRSPGDFDGRDSNRSAVRLPLGRAHPHVAPVLKLAM